MLDQTQRAHIFLYRKRGLLSEWNESARDIAADIRTFMEQVVNDTFERHISVRWRFTITEMDTQDGKDTEVYMSVLWEQPIWQFWTARKLVKRLEDLMVLIDDRGHVTIC